MSIALHMFEVGKHSREGSDYGYCEGVMEKYQTMDQMYSGSVCSFLGLANYLTHQKSLHEMLWFLAEMIGSLCPPITCSPSFP